MTAPSSAIEALRRDAAAHAALGDPARLAVVHLLAQRGDLSPRDVGRALDMPSNLLAHHVRTLEDAGIVTRQRSEADARRIYLQLSPSRLPAPIHRQLAAGAAGGRPRVVFVCTHNSARSQLASAMWSAHARGPAVSGGTHPAAAIHPGAVAVAERRGLRLPAARPRSIEGLIRPGDVVISVCDSADEELAEAGTAHVHWSVPDPVRRADDAAFDAAFDALLSRIDLINPQPLPDGAAT